MTTASNKCDDVLVLCYPWKGARLGWLTFFILTLLTAIYLFYVVLEVVFGIFDGQARQRLIDGNVFWPASIAFPIFSVGSYWCWNAYASYAAVFTLKHDGITEVFLLRKKEIKWVELKKASRIIEATRGLGREAIDRRGVRLVGIKHTMTAYEELRGFNGLRRIVTTECRSRGIPMTEMNAGWEVGRTWRGDKWRQVPGGEGWRRIFVERPVVEL